MNLWSDEWYDKWVYLFQEDMTPSELIADDTWWRVKESWNRGIRLGEETLTDLLVFDFVRYISGNISSDKQANRKNRNLVPIWKSEFTLETIGLRRCVSL